MRQTRALPACPAAETLKQPSAIRFQLLALTVEEPNYPPST